MNKLFNYLKSRSFALLLAILSVLVQSPHSFSAFYNTGGIFNNWGLAQAALFSAILDFSILFYTMRGRSDYAKAGAWAMFLINSYHYYTVWGFSWTFGFGVFLAALVPVSVYGYSEEIPEEELNKARLPELLQAEAEIGKLAGIIQQKDKYLSAAREHVAKRDLETRELKNLLQEKDRELLAFKDLISNNKPAVKLVTVPEFTEEESLVEQREDLPTTGREVDLKGPIESTGGPRDPIDEEI
jgi:hypothetical protein